VCPVHQDVYPPAEDFDIPMILLARMFHRDCGGTQGGAPWRWFRVRLTDEQQRVVNEERSCHPNPRILERMLVRLLLHNGFARQKAAQVVGIGRAAVQRYVAAFREVSLDGLRRWNVNRPVSEMGAYRELIRESFEKQPVCTVAEAGERIFQLTGLRRGPSQVRKFLKDLGLTFQRVGMIPVPPKKNWRSASKPKPIFSTLS
jgi:transposase